MENENLNTVDETTTDESTVKEQVKTEKTFSQIEVDKIVAERLSREKQSSKKIKEDADTRIKSYEEIITKFVEKEKSAVPESYRGLLEKLPLLEQYAFLTDSKNKVQKVTVPQTPKADGELKTESTKTLKNFI